MSVGHVQRAIETAGIPTVNVSVKSFGHVTELMSVPRALITPHPLGRPLGAPGDADRQRAVVERALSLLESSAPTVVEFDDPYRWAEPALTPTRT